MLNESVLQIERKLQTTLTTLLEIDNTDIMPKIVLCINKTDLIDTESKSKIEHYLQVNHPQFPCIWISAKTGIEGCRNLIDHLKEIDPHITLRLTINSSSPSNLGDFIDEIYKRSQFFQINQHKGTILDLYIAENKADEVIQWLENIAAIYSLEMTITPINQDVKKNFDTD